MGPVTAVLGRAARGTRQWWGALAGACFSVRACWPCPCQPTPSAVCLPCSWPRPLYWWPSPVHAQLGPTIGCLLRICVQLGPTIGCLLRISVLLGPDYWQHQPLHAQLGPIGGSVGSPPALPPVGLTCASKGPGTHPSGPNEPLQRDEHSHPHARRRSASGARTLLLHNLT